ncbi:MAG TPA: hypothetical protein VN754_02555 [Candidatus Binataceae bacterium]|nr:hypothetical protein [Candidatus Binataceae bacterium]
MLRAIFLVLTVVLGGCSTDEELAAQACAHVADPAAAERCQTRYLEQAERSREMQNMMIGGAMLNRPVQTSCMNIGGIVTCSSR